MRTIFSQLQFDVKSGQLEDILAVIRKSSLNLGIIQFMRSFPAACVRKFKLMDVSLNGADYVCA